MRLIKGIVLFLIGALIIVPPIVWPKVYTNLVESGKGLITVILSLLELFGLIVALVLVLFLFYQLIRYFFAPRFVFEGFSNESELLTAEHKPIYFNKLASEELAYQSQTLTNQFSKSTNNSTNNPSFLDPDADILPDPLFLIPPENLLDLNNLIVEPGADILDWVKSAEGKIPTQFGLVMSIISFLGIIIPPPIVKINAYLQSKPGKLGVTLEAVDIKNQHNFIRTFWQDEKIDKSELIQWYIDLLRPTMRWLVLECCKRRNTSKIRFINRIDEGPEDKCQAQILYLLGIQYYASAEEFKSQETTFFQSAIEHFRKASNADIDWYLPDLYLANIYSLGIRGIQEPMRSEMLELYEEALARAKKANEDVSTQHRIILAKALAELALGIKIESTELIEKAMQEIESLKKQIDPANFDTDRADCAAYLYNLAIWYELAYDNFIRIPNATAKEEARRYLAYSLARSWSLWDRAENDKNFKSLRDEGDLEILKKELIKKLSEKPDLMKMTGEDFKIEIGKILGKVDQTLHRVNL